MEPSPEMTARIRKTQNRLILWILRPVSGKTIAKRLRGGVVLRWVILAGEDRSAADRRLSRSFRDWISGEAGGTSALCDGFLGGAEELVLTQTRRIERMPPGGGLVVFKESFGAGGCVDRRLRCTAIVSAGNERAVRLLSALDAQTVTCGLSGKDTVTITSFTGDSAMLALQRSVCACSGELIQPFELPVRLGRVRDRYALMSLFAAKLLMR